jgi:hypothetical protein
VPESPSIQAVLRDSCHIMTFKNGLLGHSRRFAPSASVAAVRYISHGRRSLGFDVIHAPLPCGGSVIVNVFAALSGGAGTQIIQAGMMLTEDVFPLPRRSLGL